jgi:hypothetical protein
VFGAGGHLRTQKVSSLLGSEMRYDRYRWSSSLWISTESLLNAILAVLRMAVRSRGRTVVGFAAICVVDASVRPIEAPGMGGWQVSI